MATASDFEQSILDEPDDDALRLIYADWHEDHGEPDRADFIRVQIELSRLPEDDPRATPLRCRERELLAAHERVWAPLPGPDDPWGWTFRRGFPEAARTHVLTIFHKTPCSSTTPTPEGRPGGTGKLAAARSAEVVEGLPGQGWPGGVGGAGAVAAPRRADPVASAQLSVPARVLPTVAVDNTPVTSASPSVNLSAGNVHGLP